MARIDPGLARLLATVADALEQLNATYCLVGALVPELLLDEPPSSMTRDADIVVLAQSLGDFEALKQALERFGFAGTPLPHRIRHVSGGTVDLLPYSAAIAPTGRLQLERDTIFNVAGFGAIFPNVLRIQVAGGPVVPVAPVPLYALLKLVAYTDRKAAKDLASVAHCLAVHREHDDERFIVEFDGAGVPYEFTGAYLLGGDARAYLDDAVRDAIRPLLDRVVDPADERVAHVARERGIQVPSDAVRQDIADRFVWFRRALLGT